MAIATEVTAGRFLDIVAGTPLNNNYPLHAETEVEVVYGSQSLTAILNTDYTVELNPPNYESFTVTPLTALLTKINALIADPPTDEDEINYVTVRRSLDYLTSVQPETVRYTAFLSREIDRIHMRLIQLSESVGRKIGRPRSVIADEEYTVSAPAEGKVPVWRGNVLVAEIDAADVALAQETADLVLAAKDDAETAATNAGNSATLAEKWATEAEDVAVTPGVFSAFHWALKSAAAAASASIGNLFALTTATIATGDFLAFADISNSNVGRKATLLSAVTVTLLDEDNMASDSATRAPTQQSVKAYVDGLLNARGTLTGGAVTLDLSAGRTISATISTATTTFAFTNPLGSGKPDAFDLILTNAGSQTINWPASVDWEGGSAPTLTVAGVDHIVFTTVDGGTTWRGYVAGLDVK